MTKRQAFLKIVKSLEHTTLCKACGQSERYCPCSELESWGSATTVPAMPAKSPTPTVTTASSNTANQQRCLQKGGHDHKLVPK